MRFQRLIKDRDMHTLDKRADKAIELLEKGKLRRAEVLFKEFLTINPDYLTSHFQLARIYRLTGEYKAAVFHSHRVLRLSPNERNACLNLALIYDLMNRHKLATSYYKRELLENPDSSETLWNLGRLYFKCHRWLNASRCLRRCFENGFMFSIEDTIDKLGFCYFKLRDVHSYIEVYTAYVQMFPDASWAIANLGRALMQIKDYKRAVIRFSRALQLQNSKRLIAELTRAKKKQANSTCQPGKQ